MHREWTCNISKYRNRKIKEILYKSNVHLWQKINEELGEEKLKNLINFCLRTISELDIPIKR